VVFIFTLANSTAVLDQTYLQIVIRSIVFAAITAVICLLMGYPVAYYIGRAPKSGATRCSCWSWSPSDQLPDPHLRLGDRS
jgi:ABC-type spermidine/putrescine transport system permease subunit I